MLIRIFKLLLHQRLKELTRLKFDPVLWRQLSNDDRATLQTMAQTALDSYYSQLNA